MPSLDNLLKDFPSDQQLYNNQAEYIHLKEKSSRFPGKSAAIFNVKTRVMFLIYITLFHSDTQDLKEVNFFTSQNKPTTSPATMESQGKRHYTL